MHFDHYRIDAVIGVGGMGMVYSATDLRLGRQVALKVVLGQFAENDAFRQRFQREAAVLARLDSPHVISIYDHGEFQGWPYLVTTLAGGGDLGRLLRNEGALQPGLAAALCAQVADALGDAHRVGVIHRDVKPPNVLLRDERLDRLHIYLADFGVAATESTGLTAPGSVAGTWNYLAPERAQGDPGTAASDIYSVGCLFWECLTGRPPFTGTDVEVAMAHLQEPVPQLAGDDDFTQRANYILARSLAKDPAERYGSAEELREHLRAISLTMATSTTSGGRRRGRRKRGLALATAGAVVVAGGVVAGVLLWPNGDDDEDPKAASVAKVDPGVTGDLDDNGFGDVGISGTDFTRGAYLERYFSTGARFKSPSLSRDLTGQILVGDTDGDGIDEIIQVDFRSTDISLEVNYPGAASVASVLSAERSATSTPFAISGDFDGDGLTDIALCLEDEDGTQHVTVSPSDGEGRFTDGDEWLSIDITSEDSLRLAVGDFDGDGDDDLASVSQSTEGEGSIAFYASDGSGFEETATSSPSELDISSSGSITAGDFDGDGTDEVVSGDEGNGYLVFHLDGESVEPPEVWLIDERRAYSADKLTATDLNGDGKDDLAGEGNADQNFDFNELVPLISTGQAFELDTDFYDDRVPNNFAYFAGRVQQALPLEF